MPFEKKSVSLPRDVIAEVRQRVGIRKFSAYITEAVVQRLKRDALNDILQSMEAKFGPADDAEVSAIAQRLS